jgi:hypothetical protein
VSAGLTWKSIVQALREHLGLLSPDQIRTNCDELGLSQRERSGTLRDSSENGQLLGDNSGTAGGPFSAATGLGFAGFLVPLLQPMLGVGSDPTTRQQGF